jgi:adenine phosphoribosyltransferase
MAEQIKSISSGIGAKIPMSLGIEFLILCKLLKLVKDFTQMIAKRIKSAIRDIENYPKVGIIFKDLTPILQDPKLCNDIVDEFYNQLKNKGFEAICCLDARGFWFGLSLSMKLGIPMVPIRKKGKLPYQTLSKKYDLEYGSAEIEIHSDALKKGMKVLIHDDLLATGGTAKATAELVQELGAEVAGFAFLVELSFLEGKEKLGKSEIYSMVVY